MKQSGIEWMWVLLLVLGSAGSPAGAAEGKLTFGALSKSLGYAPYTIAKHFRWFETDPVLKRARITSVTYEDQPAIHQAFERGELQVLLSAGIPAILCRAQGNDIRVVDLLSTVTLPILARVGKPIASVSDLRGKTIGVLQGTTAHYGLLRALGSAGLAEADAVIKYLPPPAAKAAFAAGELDAWAIWPPFIDEEVVAGSGRAVPGSAYEVAVTIAVPNSLISREPDSIRAILSILERGKAWLGQNRAEAERILAAELGLDLKVVQEGMKRFNYAAKIDDRILADLQRKADFVAEREKTRLNRAVDVRKELVDLRFTTRKR
jgi:sulfonate transport system substrate-binding protein